MKYPVTAETSNFFDAISWQNLVVVVVVIVVMIYVCFTQSVKMLNFKSQPASEIKAGTLVFSPPVFSPHYQNNPTQTVD